MKDGSEQKMMPLFWLHWLHAPSLVSIGLDKSYPYSKFSVNRPKQTKVIERKPKVDARPPAHPPSISTLQ